MGTDKRARQKANRAAKLATQDTVSGTSAGKPPIGIIAVIAALVIGAIVLFVLLTGGDDNEIAVIATQTDSVPADFEAFSGSRALTNVAPAARNSVYDAAPPMTIDPAQTYSAVFNTTVGDIRVNLFADETPITVNNFVNLAEDGFYDGLSFHRVIPGFMAQGGDPTGTGSGGPGYSFEDEVNTGRVFDDRGILAMANSGPNTNGSQFFITYAPTDWLNDLHTIFGEIADDAPALEEIPETGAGDTVIINSIEIIEG